MLVFWNVQPKTRLILRISKNKYVVINTDALNYLKSLFDYQLSINIFLDIKNIYFS